MSKSNAECMLVKGSTLASVYAAASKPAKNKRPSRAFVPQAAFAQLADRCRAAGYWKGAKTCEHTLESLNMAAGVKLPRAVIVLAKKILAGVEESLALALPYQSTIRCRVSA